MTQEELQALVEELKASNEAMANKNKELLAEVKKERQKSKEVNVDEHYKLLDELESVKSENAKLSGEVKLKAKDLEKLTASLGEKDKSIHKLLVSDGITKELAGLGIEDIDTLMPYFERNATVENGVALVNGKPIKDAMTEWADGAGKRYIPASQNSGGGANGGSGGGTDSKKFFDRSSPEFNLTKQAEIMKTNPTLYATLKG